VNPIFTLNINTNSEKSSWLETITDSMFESESAIVLATSARTPVLFSVST
jgi:hypothetical protein